MYIMARPMGLEVSKLSRMDTKSMPNRPSSSIRGDCCLLECGKIDAPESMIEEVRNEMQELVRAQKNVERFLQRKRTPPRKHRPAKRIPPRRVPSWETSSAVFLVYIAVLRRNAPVTRIFSLRSFRVLQRTKACTAGSETYIPHRKTTVCIEVWQ